MQRFQEKEGVRKIEAEIRTWRSSGRAAGGAGMEHLLPRDGAR